MVNPYRYQSPDTRLRHIRYAREQEEARAAKLDEQDSRRLLNIQGQMETEQARGADLDRQDSVQEEMRFEQARGAELDRRDRERPATPPVSEWMPQRDEAAALRPTLAPTGPAFPVPGDPTFEPRGRVLPAEAAPYLREMIPRWQRETTYLGPEGQEYQPLLPVPGEPMYEPRGQLPAADTTVLERTMQRRWESGAGEAVAARGREGLPLPSVPFGLGKPLEYAQERFLDPTAAFMLQVAETRARVTRGLPPEKAEHGVVNPIPAMLGNEEEQGRAQQVLEDAGIVKATAARVVFDPLNFIPIVGFTKADDFVRALKLAGKATGPARQSIVRSRAFQEVIEAIRHGERGGTRLGGPLGPRESVLEKLRTAGQQAPEGWAENIRLSRETFGERAKASAELRDRLMSEGVSEQEAILKSTAELRGEMPFKAATGLDFTPAEEAWFWDGIIQGSQAGESIHVATYMQEMKMAMAAGKPIKDLPPHVWKVISKAHGEDFANQLKEVVKQRAGASEAALMAKAPEGVAPGPPVPTAKGAEQAVFHPEFPAPGTTLSEVAMPERAGILDFLSDTLGILKPLMSSGDISWFRQIAKTMGRHPTLAWRSFVKGTKALVSERLAVETMDALKAEGTAAAGYRQVVRTTEGTREIGLGRLLEDRYMAVPGTPGFAESSILRRPEFYMSRQAARWFGIKQSGRAFATGWNTNYQGIARYWLPKLTKMNKGALTQKQVDAALNLAERLTGVGKLGSDQSWIVKALKVLGFAPGYRVSGPEALVTLLSPTTDPLIRRMAFENLVTWATLGGSIMSAAKYGAGASVISTLGASQFGRIKFPGSDTYYNIWGTDGVLARAVLQAIVQMRVDVKGNVTLLGDGEKTPKGFAEAFKDSFLLYLRSGEAPAWGLLSDLTTGETYIGEKLHWDPESAWKVVRDRLPMFGQDMMDVMQTDGPIQTLLSFIPGATGTAGITSYEPIRETARAMPKYLTSDEAVVEDVLGIDVPGPLSLTANEERALLAFLREDVHDWVEEREDKRGPLPEHISTVQVIQKVGEEKGLSRRDIWGAIFLHKAKSNPDAMNPEWMRFLLENRERLEDYYEETYEADYMQAAQQWAEEQGLVPVR